MPRVAGHFPFFDTWERPGAAFYRFRGTFGRCRSAQCCMAVTWGRIYCCNMCRKDPGEHGEHCDRLTLPAETDGSAEQGNEHGGMSMSDAQQGRPWTHDERRYATDIGTADSEYGEYRRRKRVPAHDLHDSDCTPGRLEERAATGEGGRLRRQGHEHTSKSSGMGDDGFDSEGDEQEPMRSHKKKRKEGAGEMGRDDKSAQGGVEDR